MFSLRIPILRVSPYDGDPRMQNESVSPTDAGFRFTGFLFYWLDSIKATIAYTTYNGYTINLTLVKRYFDELYPGLLLTDLTALQIQKFYNDMYNEGKSGNTIKHYYANIHKALKYAVKMDLLIANPADKVELPKQEKFRASFYTKEEINQLLKVFEGDRMELVVNIAAYYGLRRSEVLGLKWDAIDFDKGTLSVCRKITSINADGHEQLRVDDTLKTEASVRTLPLIPFIGELLKDKKAQDEYLAKLLKHDYCHDYDDYICTDHFGKLITPVYVTDHFANMIKKHRLKKIRFHDLRHSCASLLLANGVPMKEIQEWLGHSTFQVTADFYSHLEYNSKVNSANAIANALGTGSVSNKAKADTSPGQTDSK